MVTETVDVTRARGCAPITEEMHDPVDALLVVGVEASELAYTLYINQVYSPNQFLEKCLNSLPEDSLIKQIRLRMTLMRPIHRSKLDRVPDEENRLEEQLARGLVHSSDSSGNNRNTVLLKTQSLFPSAV